MRTTTKTNFLFIIRFFSEREKKKENSALSEHACVTNHEIAWENSKILTMHQSALPSKTSGGLAY